MKKPSSLVIVEIGLIHVVRFKEIPGTFGTFRIRKQPADITIV